MAIVSNKEKEQLMKKTRSVIMCLGNEVFHDVVEKGMIVKLVETRNLCITKNLLQITYI